MISQPFRDALRLRLSPRERSLELRDIGSRARQTGLLAVVTGAITGLGVAVFDRLVGRDVFDQVLSAPLWVQAIGPAVGLTIAALSLRWLAGSASPSTADEYIKDFHEPEHRVDPRPAPGRLIASAATLGGGSALGFEGPAIYLGATVGSWLQHRFSRFFARGDSKVLLVCGAAAGVAAIFKAPATGVVFALEVPYQQDLARRMLLPAMFSAAASYVVFAAINGTAPLFPIAGAPPFDLRDLGGAALLGLGCGLLARIFTAGIRLAKEQVTARPAPLRVAVAGAGIAILFAASRLLTGESLTLGSGYGAIAWALRPNHAIAVVLGVFMIRAGATTLAVAAGGVGGLFIPLVVQGALLGAAVGGVIDAPTQSLFPLLGVAAFLGAGYRVPLAAIVFVAESTGRPGFVVPGLIAAASSQLFMGASSASSYQQDSRVGLLERRLRLPIAAALRVDAATVSPDITVTEMFEHHIAELRLRAIAVVADEQFLGMVVLSDIARLPRSEWDAATAEQLMRVDWPVGRLEWTISDAVVAMEAADVDRLAVNDDGKFAGIVTTGEILKLDAILETAEAQNRRD